MDIPAHINDRIAERMIDVVAGIADPEHRAALADLLPSSTFIVREDGTVDVTAITEHGPVTLARLDGATVGIVAGPDGLTFV